MAISGFMPAWMKISNSDKSTGNQKLNIDRSNDNKRQLQNEINAPIIKGHYRTKFNEQQSSADSDEQSENFFSFQSRRSYSRERLLNAFAKGSEFTTNDHLLSSNNRSTTNSNRQRRLHSVSTAYNSGQTSANNRNTLTNGISLERLSNDNHERLHGDNYFDATAKFNENKFDPLEKDFPSLSGRDSSANHKDQSSIWNNASSKFRISNYGKFPRPFGSDRLSTRRDRLFSTPNNLNTNNRSMVQELQTSCITQTKNLDKRSEFFNSLKNGLVNENKDPLKKLPKSIEDSFDQALKQKQEGLVLLSLPETSEEKDLLIRMGWNDDMNYEITDKDKEEYEKQIKIFPKTDNRSAALITALHRRSLPCINIRDVLQLEMVASPSDDESSED